MRLLIINANRYRQPVPVIPIGACMIAETARRIGHTPHLLDLTFDRSPSTQIERTITDFKPDLVGFSIRNIDNIDYQNPWSFLSEFRGWIRTARSKTDCPICIGGSGVLIAPREMLRELDADYAFDGSGDRDLSLFLDQMSRNCVIGRESRVFSAARLEPDMSLYPELFAWVDRKRYRRHGATVPIQTKRGCRHTCTYCTYPLIEGTKYLLADPGDVGSAFERMIRDGLNDFEFVDNVFNSPREHAGEICEVIIRKGLNLRLTAMDLHPVYLDRELLDLMHRSGFRGIGITAESAANNVLEGLGKDFRNEDLWATASRIRDTLIPCAWIFLVGGPGETEATLDETCRFIREAIRPTDLVFITIGVRVYPGTGMQTIDSTIRADTQKSKPLDTRFYISPDLDIDHAVRTISNLAHHHPNVIDSTSISAHTIRRIHYLAGCIGLHPPLWRYTYRLKRWMRTLGVKI